MYLTKDEERMLRGEDDYVAMKCMEYLVKYGEAAGAQRLIDIDGTVNARPASGIAGVDLAGPEMRGKKVRVFTHMGQTQTPVDGWEDVGFAPWNDPAHHQEFVEALKPGLRCGVHPTLSCTYYLVSTVPPTVGRHCAWTESSAMPWCNAILGARTNLDGCFAAAYVGKIPEYGMHLDENRVGTHLVKVDAKLRSPMDYDLVGFHVGDLVGMDVPVFTGLPTPSVNELIKLNSALNTTGAVWMYHIPGVTPEGPTVEAAFNGEPPTETLHVGWEELKSAYDTLNQTGSTETVDFVFIGCPHCTLDQLREVAAMLEGRRCRSTLWIMTNPWTFRLAEFMGYRATIKQAGGILLSGTCPGLMGCLPPNTEVMATNSAKQGYYIHGLVYPRKLGVWYGTTKDCIQAALTGQWRGTWQEGA